FLYPGVGGGPGPLTVVTQSPLQVGLIDRAYSQSLVASGGVSPYTWSLTADSGPLPSGLVFSSGGLISATPTTHGTSIFAAQVADAASDTAQKDLAITVRRSSSEFDSTFESQDVPTKMEPGQGFIAVVKFLNNGAQSWNPGGLYLRSQNPTDNAVWG